MLFGFNIVFYNSKNLNFLLLSVPSISRVTKRDTPSINTCFWLCNDLKVDFGCSPGGGGEFHSGPGVRGLGGGRQLSSESGPALRRPADAPLRDDGEEGTPLIVLDCGLRAYKSSFYPARNQIIRNVLRVNSQASSRNSRPPLFEFSLAPVLRYITRRSRFKWITNRSYYKLAALRVTSLFSLPLMRRDDNSMTEFRLRDIIVGTAPVRVNNLYTSTR